MPELFQKVELVEGDGGVGTVVKITLAPGILGLSPYKDRFAKIDNEKRIKELEVIEGGPLKLGFTKFRGWFEVIEKGEESSMIKSTIEYQLQEDFADNNDTAHLVSDFNYSSSCPHCSSCQTSSQQKQNKTCTLSKLNSRMHVCFEKLDLEEGG
ncbi:norbelladine synthase-like [Prosopis cineraria]|uniref:norbelladine synthase-like n=1 Tax=Prosopis cineraria TaxID=364024 RepID=UPI0024109693|nr:norbelladine synthase-like [Prosopis cineraria]